VLPNKSYLGAQDLELLSKLGGVDNDVEILDACREQGGDAQNTEHQPRCFRHGQNRGYGEDSTLAAMVPQMASPEHLKVVMPAAQDEVSVAI